MSRVASRPEYPAGLAAAGSHGRWLVSLALAALAVAAAAVIVALEPLGPVRQRVTVLALTVAIPTLLAFLARPHRGLQLYLVLLPLMISGAVVGGLNAGEALTLGIVVLGGITSWSERARIGPALRELGPILWPIAALGLVSVASLLVNGVTDFAEILSAVFKMLAFGLIAVIVYLHASTAPRARGLLLAVLIGALVEAAYSLGAYALGLNYYETYGYNRATGTFTTWNHLGGFMAMTSVPTLAYALHTRRPALRWLLLVAFVAEIVTLLLSLTLGSILGLLVGGLVAGVLIFHIPLRRLIGAAFAFGGVFVLVYLANPLLQEKVARVGERVVDRLITYSVGIAMLRDQFWLGFGSQTRVAEALFSPFGDYTLTRFGESGVVPHASVLSIGVEKGVLGIVFFLLLIAGVLRILMRQRDRFQAGPENLVFQGIVVGLLAFLVQDMTNNLLLHARLGIIFFALVAVTAALGGHAERARITAADR